MLKKCVPTTFCGRDVAAAMASMSKVEVLVASIASGAATAAVAWLAAMVCLAGLLAERWLFFAEAQHTVRLYHGAPRT